MDKRRPELEILKRLELYFSLRQLNKAIRRFSDVFEHDYDTAIIFLTVAEAGFRSIVHLAATEADIEQFEKIYMDEATVGLTLLSIGEASGIPRETVRRKVKWLIERDFLAASNNNKSIYLPLSTVGDQRFVDIFSAHSADVVQLVKTIQFYVKSGT